MQAPSVGAAALQQRAIGRYVGGFSVHVHILGCFFRSKFVKKCFAAANTVRRCSLILAVFPELSFSSNSWFRYVRLSLVRSIAACTEWL